MPEATDLRLPGSGLHPSHFAALRIEILRTGAELSQEQLLDLTDGLCRLIRVRRPERPIRRHETRADGQPRAFA